MSAVIYPYYLAGRASAPNRDLEVRDKYSGGTISAVPGVGEDQLRRAIELGFGAELGVAPNLPLMVTRASSWIRARRSEIESLLCGETGRPLEICRHEVNAAIEGWTPRLSLDAPMDGAVWGLVLPRAFPFDALVGLVHEALASGHPFILCPHPQTPLSALYLGDLLELLELPAGTFSILPLDESGRSQLAEDPRVVTTRLRPVAFDPRTGERLPDGPITLVSRAARRALWLDEALLHLAFRSGLRPLDHLVVEDAVWESWVPAFVRKVEDLATGNPHELGIEVGPAGSLSEADGIERWIAHAREQGAELLCGGRRRGVLIEATVLAITPDTELDPLPLSAPILVITRTEEGAGLDHLGSTDPARLVILGDDAFENEALERGFAGARRLEPGGLRRLEAAPNEKVLEAVDRD